MLQLEKELEEDRLKWVDLAKERLALVPEVKKVTKLEADVIALQKNGLRAMWLLLS